MNISSQKEYNSSGNSIRISKTMPISNNTNQTDNQRHNSALVPSGASSIPIGGSSIVGADFFSNQSHACGDIVVHNHDVLSGRGVHIAHHPGNERFRTLVTSFTDKHYCTSYTVTEKKALAMQIIHHIRSLDPPGRFLKREGKAGASRGLSGPWQVLTEREIIKKACQALRDCNRQDRVGYADGVKPPEDVKQVAETLSRTGLSVRERAVAAAVALEKLPNSNHSSMLSTCRKERSPIDTRNFGVHNIQDNTQMGVKRTKDEIDKEYYASLSSKGGQYESRLSTCQVGMTKYTNTVSKGTMEPKQLFDMQYCHSSLRNGQSTPSHFYYKNSNSQLWGSGQGSVPYANMSHGRDYYFRPNGYNEYNYGKNSMSPSFYHPYGLTDTFHIDSGFSHSFEDLHADFNNRVNNSYNPGSTEQLYPRHNAKRVHDDTYRDFIPSKPAALQNQDPHNLISFEEAWPVKKPRTDEIDSTIGISTSASSPSTPAALGNNDDLAITSSIPASSDTVFKNVVGTNSSHVVYADMFKADDVDDWDNDPITADSLGVGESEEGGIEDDLNADELFSF
jgi:hypothetical protein